MENIITIRLADEDRARLDEITTLLTELAKNDRPDCSSCVLDVTKAVGSHRLGRLGHMCVSQSAEEKPVQEPTAPQEQAAEHPVADPFPTPEEPAPAEETPTPAEEKEPTVTLEQIQQKVVKLAASGAGVKDPALIEQAKAKKAKVRDIINAHAPKVSELPPECWSTVWAELTALESEA